MADTTPAPVDPVAALEAREAAVCPPSPDPKRMAMLIILAGSGTRTSSR